MSETITVNPKYPVKIGERDVASFSIKPQTFTGYVNTIRSVQTDQNFATAFWREWVLRHVAAHSTDGEEIAFTLADLLSFPAAVGMQLHKLQPTTAAPGGVVTGGGDGIDDPITFQLHDPLPGGAEGVVITGLKFQAPTVGDVEPVIVAASQLDQTAALLEHCAAPVGDGVTLLRLPGFALDAVSAGDGLAILAQILPAFAGPASPSYQPESI